MDNLIRFLYCLVVCDNFERNICQYAKYLSEMEKRTLSLAKRFYIRDPNSAQKLLEYIMKKEECFVIATQKYQNIERMINEREAR